MPGRRRGRTGHESRAGWPGSADRSCAALHGSIAAADHVFGLLILLALLLLPGFASAETLSDGIAGIVAGLDLSGIEAAMDSSDALVKSGGLRETVEAIARGELTIDPEGAAALLGSTVLSSIQRSLWRLTRLMAPAMLWSLLRRLSGRSSETGRVICQLIVCVFLTQDLTEHITLATGSVERMAQGMESLFPLLLTLMSAVGGAAGSALLQPAIVATASAMTGLIREVTVPLVTAAAILTMLCHLGDGLRLQRLAAFVHSCASWTLGVSFTVFIGVLTTRSVTAAALDGVTLRTAKYALSSLIPVVGGLFADTVDTLIGSSMLVQGALGVTGLLLIAGTVIVPLCQTLVSAMLYRFTSAMMQPVSDGPLSACIHDFGRVLMLLFVIQLSAAAMFLMLIAQVVSVSGMTMMLR